MDRRLSVQLAFLALGILIWAYGQRIDDPRIRLVGIAFLAVAFLLRFFRRSDTRHHEPEDEDEVESEP